MLFAASESAVTKKPRLRLTRRRSSSVSPFGSFHSAMSRLIAISCGIQWFAQVARYFSHAHLYLKGTNWLTSAPPMMMRLSSTRTRRVLCETCEPAWRRASAVGDADGAGITGARAISAKAGAAAASTGRAGARVGAGWTGVEEIGSSQDSI